MQISTSGVVIRDYKYEDSRILTLLTQSEGIVTAFAPQANRPKNPMAGSTELFCYSDFVLFRNKEKTYVNASDSKRIFFGLRSNFESYALASYFAQLTEELAPKGEDCSVFIQLILSCLHYLESGERPRDQLKSIFELRLLTLSGYMPDLIGCRVCSEHNASDMHFTADGDLICSNCLGSGGGAGLYKVAPGVLAAMRHIIYAEAKKIFAFTLPDDKLKQLEQIVEDYLIYQLEKTLPTLEFYRSVR